MALCHSSPREITPSLTPDCTEISKAQPLPSLHSSLLHKIRVFHSMTYKGSFGFEIPCSTVLKPGESPGVLHKTDAWGSGLEVLGHPVQGVAGVWVCFKALHGILLCNH